jgi:hypothetical protein
LTASEHGRKKGTEEVRTMTKIKIVFAVTTLLMATTAFAASTTEGRFHKLWEKSVTVDGNKPKVACICLATGALGSVNFVPLSNDAFVFCGIPTFDQDGTLSSLDNCGGAFAVLTK